MIIVINTGVGNIGSIPNMIKRLGVNCVVSDKPDEFKSASRFILPGVGHFDSAVKSLKEKGLWEILNDKVINQKTPILGICLGMQLLANRSEEGTLEGFGWICGQVRKFHPIKGSQSLKVPHMGWNVLTHYKEPLFSNFDNEPRFYFAHSYYYECNNHEDILAQTYYGHHYASAIGKDHIFGVQFHPEKSHRFGLQLFSNFLKITEPFSYANSSSNSSASSL